MSFRVDEDGQFRGAVTLLNAKLNDGSVSNQHVAASAGIAADKLQQQHRQVFAQKSDATAAAEERIVHVIHGASGTIKTFKAGCVEANMVDATITVDLHKNGSTVLTAPIILDNGDAAYDLVEGTIDDDSVVVDDVLEVTVTVDAGVGTLGKGVFAYVDIYESAI